jgi:hypothetical protein
MDLRKAKDLVCHRPTYFTAIAIGLRKDFVVEYTAADGLRLRWRRESPSRRELRAAAGHAYGSMYATSEHTTW